MTPAQNALYWRMWQAACKANAWRAQKGCLPNTEPTEDKSEMACAVLGAAAHLASAHHRAVTLDDIRHAVHFVAAGRDCGHDKLSNTQFTRVLLLLKLLIDPLDLGAMNEWLNPELEQRRRMDAIIEKVPQAIVAGIVRNRPFEVRDWRTLDDAQKQRLVIILRQRRERQTFKTTEQEIPA